jgi:hypothetical protein
MPHPPIKDPQLAEVSELLHRMAACRARDPFTWMAREAIAVLRKFAERHEPPAQKTE